MITYNQHRWNVSLFLLRKEIKDSNQTTNTGYEVEEGVLKHDAVEDCAVIGVPGEMGEEDIKLFVIIKTDRALTAEDLRKYCATHMAKFMVPKHIVFLNEIPRTLTGKPEKRKLAGLKENDRQASIN